MVPFGPLGDLPATATVQARINTAFDNLFHHDQDGRRHAVVCTFCDEYILSRHDRNFFPIKMVRKSRHLFEWTKYIKDPSELRALEPLIAAYTFHHELSNYSFQPIRNRGLNGCGCNNKIPEIVVEDALEDEHDDWVDVVPVQISSQINTSNSVTEIPEWKVLDIVKLLLRKTAARSRPKVFKSNVEETVCEANGSMDSILQWGLAAQLDPKQKRAFESIISSFLLTFHDFQQDDYNDSTLTQGSCDHALRTKDQLLFLKGGEGTQLIMMLHGMGGSGKSTVIALVMAYAQEYCENLQHPFTIQTIVVTALSGVAATLIHGGTTHMAMGLRGCLDYFKIK